MVKSVMKKLKVKKGKPSNHQRGAAQKQLRGVTRKHTASAKDVNVKEVFDGSWPDSDTINFVQNGLSDAGR